MTARPKIPYAEQKRRGQAIYDAQIRRLIVPEDEGKFVLVDILTGDYEIDTRAVLARIRLRARRPDAVIHTMRRHKTYVGRVLSPRRIRRQARKHEEFPL